MQGGGTHTAATRAAAAVAAAAMAAMAAVLAAAALLAMAALLAATRWARAVSAAAAEQCTHCTLQVRSAAGPPRHWLITHHHRCHGRPISQHVATFFWQVAAAVLPLAPGAEVDFPDFTGAFYALLRNFQRLSGPHQLRCEPHARLQRPGVTGGSVTAPCASVLIWCLYTSIFRIMQHSSWQAPRFELFMTECRCPCCC